MYQFCSPLVWCILDNRDIRCLLKHCRLYPSAKLVVYIYQCLRVGFIAVTGDEHRQKLILPISRQFDVIASEITIVNTIKHLL